MICGYTADPDSPSVVRFSCCEMISHKKCWDNASLPDASFSKPSCNKIATFLQKDGVSPRDSWVESPSATTQTAVGGTQGSSVSQTALSQPPVPETPRVIICEFCECPIAFDDKNHYMETCKKLNDFSEPYSRPERGSVELTPYATRVASMTLARPQSCTPKRRSGRIKQ